MLKIVVINSCRTLRAFPAAVSNHSQSSFHFHLNPIEQKCCLYFLKKRKNSTNFLKTVKIDTFQYRADSNLIFGSLYIQGVAEYLSVLSDLYGNVKSFCKKSQMALLLKLTSLENGLL